MKSTALLTAFVLLAGCATTAVPQGTDERKILTEIVQLTHSFGKAGEGYFSPDMKWIIFQAAPGAEQNYQMFIAPLHIGQTPPAGRPIQISPHNSRNTCGYFSPDGASLIFASTAGKEDPNEPSAGYQRKGGSYRWDFPTGMEIYRADNWRAAIAGGKTEVNL